jgi:uncharacterized membrane protein
MGKSRLEAFSDGVIAIIITIMVLELRTPHDSSFESLFSLWPIFLSYLLSFIYVGIYWNNHHHMLQLCRRVTGGILWANLHLLFWLSLVPFATGWLGENHFATNPTAFYGIVLFMSAIAYWILQTTIICSEKNNSELEAAIGKDLKGKLSPLLYLTAVGICFLSNWISMAIYVLVALMWLIPDRRIEKSIAQP